MVGLVAIFDMLGANPNLHYYMLYEVIYKKHDKVHCMLEGSGNGRWKPITLWFYSEVANSL